MPSQPDQSSHFIRPRINALLVKAIEKPLVIVCAGAGCGKTCAVSDYLRQHKHSVMWMQFSERDNIASRFWETTLRLRAALNPEEAERIREIGFPDTADRMNRFLSQVRRSAAKEPITFVVDDFHLARDRGVLGFMEQIISSLSQGRLFILICRELPDINIEPLRKKGLVSEIHESDLNFTEHELAEYFRQQGLPADRQILSEVLKDTSGWAFSVNLVARSLKRAPGYFGYVKDTLKQNIFKLMEAESWKPVPERLRRFLIRLSLLDHLSAKLVHLLVAGDDILLSGLRQQNAYIRLDRYSGTYQIHSLFLDFLCTKQDILTEDEKRETWQAAAGWCWENHFTVDALGLFEKANDYESIVAIFGGLIEHTTYDLALYAAGIFERAPEEVYDRVDFFAAIHLFNLFYLGRWQECLTLAERYEQRALPLPEDDTFRNHTLGGIYYAWATVRALMSTFDDRYDFDVYHTKAIDCLAKTAAHLLFKHVFPLGAWVSTVGSARTGALQEFAASAQRLVEQTAHSFPGALGLDVLCRGELAFYQGDFRVADTLFLQELEKAQSHRQFDHVRVALYYRLRIAAAQGDRVKAEQALTDIKVLLDEEAYSRRFIAYDTALGLYQCILRQPEMVPDWLKGKFAPYSHAYLIENLGNQIKARYCYLTRDYQPLLSYIGEMKLRESILYGRAEMLALEACVRYKMKDSAGAFRALQDAHSLASPNGIVMPFIELGKDMRTLTTTCLRQGNPSIPQEWLKTINVKSAIYARHQSMVIASYKSANGIDDSGEILSSRETQVLRDLYHGLSHTEVAVNQGLSIGAVKMIHTSIFRKLGAERLVDAVRIAIERGILP